MLYNSPMKKIDSLLMEKIADQNAVFVFPTDIACQKWADWAVRNTPVKAVAMERFLAWDKFKGERIRADAAGLRTVPSLMRKIFADCLVQKNARRPFFKSIIIEEYAGEAGAFSAWLGSVLPSLKMWRNLRDRQSECPPGLFADSVLSDDDAFLKEFYESYKSSGFTDAEDEDFEILFAEYSRFLEENSFFDPAWIEPDFSDDGHEYFLIYPEILEDWEQYRHRLSGIEKIHILPVPEEEGGFEARFFENSSLEIKDVALFLRQAHDEGGVFWSDMAVSVPSMDSYGSYLEREFSLYEIPVSMRYSRPLSSYGAGAFFSQLQECVERQFSYDSLKALLLNEDLPWANKAAIENLLLFGRMNNCICTAGPPRFERGRAVTVWDEAFASPKDDRGIKLNSDELIRNLYKNLAEMIPSMVNAESFAGLRAAYERFRETFFDMALFEVMPLSDNVLSRCVTALNEIVELESEFPSCKVASPFSFFVAHLSTVRYLSQGETRAVQVYPYKSAAAAPYKIHVVAGSTQDALSVADSFRPLDFMNENKRRIFMRIGSLDKSLGFSDSDPTFDFVRLYQHSALEKAYFTASRRAFNGEYGFVYGKLGRVEEGSCSARKDLFMEERRSLLSSAPYSDFERVYAKQRKGLAAWIGAHKSDKEDSGLFEKREEFTRMIESRLRMLRENPEGRGRKNPLLLGRIEITQKTLKSYFKCPRRWLFKDVLRLNAPDKEAELIDEYILGTVNHKVFENFFTLLKEGDCLLEPDGADSDRLSPEYRRLLVSAVNSAVSVEGRGSAFNEIFSSSQRRLAASSTTIKIVSAQYEIGDGESARGNGNFRMLERSLARFCANFRGYKVHAVEKEVEALPPRAEDAYYLAGKIDCILFSPAEGVFALVDYKTSSLPGNLMVKAQETGKRENVIDFQMPMYIYLLENNVNEDERLDISIAEFYSIKKAEERPFLGQSPYGKANKSSPEDAALARAEMLRYAKRFFDEVGEERFAVSALSQSRSVCGSKGRFDNCIDFQALCRRYFTVSGS